jgi:hypothetical protein
MLVSGARSLSMSSTVVASQQQISCDVADEAVLLSVQSGEYYGLNPVAASIWRLIQKPSALADIREALLQEYGDVSPEQCNREILAFLDQMLALGLVEFA